MVREEKKKKKFKDVNYKKKLYLCEGKKPITTHTEWKCQWWGMSSHQSALFPWRNEETPELKRESVYCIPHHYAVDLLLHTFHKSLHE